MRRFLVFTAMFCLTLPLAACEQESPNSPTEPGGEAEGLTSADTAVLEAHSESGFGLDRTVRSYEITLENLTPDTGDGGSQVFSPPVLATHQRSARLFRVGSRASEELAGLAEDAVNAPLVESLKASKRVFQVLEGDGVIPPGQSATYQIQTRAGMRRLSMAFMLVNTNDGFGGLEGRTLPRHGEKIYDLYAYDAGSELNTELISDIPGPCCGSPGSGTPTHERIRLHEGIEGVGDLSPEKWGWEGPVARLTIRALTPVYEITLENLTPDTGDGGSQVFSPPVLATHGRGVAMFRVGHLASEELAAIAEDAINQPMIDRLEASDRVRDVVEGGGVVFPGAFDTYRVEGAPRAHRLSMAFMLVNTNDGFSGVSSLRLPADGRVSYYLRAYDAGSELNTELIADIPGPCCGSPKMGTPTQERIRPHRGIRGDGDLDPEKWGWHGPVAKLTLTRVR